MYCKIFILWFFFKYDFVDDFLFVLFLNIINKWNVLIKHIYSCWVHHVFIIAYLCDFYYLDVVLCVHLFRERGLRRLREELRAEEMKLVILKKLKQSQQLKENVAVLPPSIPQSALPPTGLPSGLSITPTTVKVPSTKTQQPQIAHSRHMNSHKPGQNPVPPLLRGVSIIVCFF